MKGSTHKVLSTVIFASLLAAAAGVAQAAAPRGSGGQAWNPQSAVASATVHCERRAVDASGNSGGAVVARHLIRDAQGCIIAP